MTLILFLFLMGFVRGDDKLSECCRHEYKASAESNSTEFCTKNITRWAQCYQSITTDSVSQYMTKCDVKLFSKFMNKSVDPCQDFYKYVCSGYTQKRHISFLRMTMDTVDNQLKNLFEEKIGTKEPDYVKTIKSFYKVCMDESKVKSGLQSYNRIYRNDWATLNPDWREDKFNLRKLVGKYESEVVSGLFSVVVYHNRAFNTMDGLAIWKPELKWITMRGPKNSSAVREYQQLYVDIAMELGADNETALRDAKEMLDFERQLARIKFTQDRSAKRRVSELQEKYTFVNWLEVIKAMFSPGDRKSAKLNNDTQLLFWLPGYFDQLVDVLAKSSKRAIQNYYAFKFARKFLPETNRRMQNIFLQYKHKGQELNERWDQCVFKAYSYFDYGVGKMFVDRFYGKDSQIKTKIMAESIVDQLKKLFENSTWMSQETKKMIKNRFEVNTTDFALTMNAIKNARKSLKLNDFIAYDMHEDLREHMDPLGYFGSIHTAANKIGFPARPTILPVLSLRERSSLNYAINGAKLSQIIAQAITNTLDEDFRKHRPGLHKLMTTKDIETYNRRSMCFKQQLNSSKQYRVHETIKSQTGLLATFRASMAASSRESEQALQGLGLTLNRQFFVALQMWDCEPLSSGDNWGQALKNSKEFAEAFDCAKGSNMNPEAKCFMWE